MFKNVYTLAILTHLACIVGGVFFLNNTTQQCNEHCNNLCDSCPILTTCDDDEIDCGLDDPDPHFGSLCSLAKRICVGKNCTCKYMINGHVFVYN